MEEILSQESVSYSLFVEDFVSSFSAAQAGWIYVIHAIGTNRYKIGRSANPETRLKQLNQQQSAYPLSLVYKSWSLDAISDEQHLHNTLADFRVHGEWFEFENDGGIPWIINNPVPNRACAFQLMNPSTHQQAYKFLIRWLEERLNQPINMEDEELSHVVIEMMQGFELVENRVEALFWARLIDHRVPKHIEEHCGKDATNRLISDRLNSFLTGAWDAMLYFSSLGANGGRHD